MISSLIVLGSALGLVICLGLLASWIIDKAVKKESVQVEEARPKSGFSLSETLFVSATILILAAVAIPNLIRARMAANEASAVADVRTLNTALLSYQESHGSYPSSISKLAEPDVNLISPVLASGMKNGYKFEYDPQWVEKDGYKAVAGYIIFAKPIGDKTGRKPVLRVSADGVIEYSFDGSTWREFRK